jgi:EAL domain-containing protein (putative c-di-GMP-specific phosphodiesterase class I)/GGDEF domain-containing protein
MKTKTIPRLLKNTFILFSSFIVIFFLLSWLFLSNYKEKALQYAKSNYELNIDTYTNKFDSKLILFDKNSIQEYLENIKKTEFIQDVKIEYLKILFNKESLIFQTKSFSDTSWNLINVMVDIKFGEIKKVEGTTYFEFIPSHNFNPNENLIVKYQLLKNNEIKNFVVPIELNILENKKIEVIKRKFLSIFKYFYNINFEYSIQKELKVDNIAYAKIEYILDDSKLKEDIHNFFIKLILFSFLAFLPIYFILFYYEKYIEKEYIQKPIAYLDNLVSNILDSKFSNIDNDVFKDSNEYKNLLSNISKLSNKVASLVNELNINKETLERNLLTDNLTGLYDKKMFDIDIKSMFVYSDEGYILSLRISKLNEIESLNGSIKTDNFILSYVNIINNVIDSYKNNNIIFYRFHGSEFIILAKDFSYTDAIELSEKITNSLNDEIYKNYILPNSIFHIGGTPFNVYGTIDSIMSSVNSAHKEAISKDKNGYVIIKENTIKEEIIETETQVKSIIMKKYFDISFVFDSYSFEDELLMRELKPILRDENNVEIPIGSFIAICEKLNINQKFDEEVILKAVDFVNANKINYKIAINLSIRTISNKDFINFLDNLVAENPDIIKNILFSITSYSASAYKFEFIQFVKELNRLKIEILMKRFKTKEYSLDELVDLNINYIKIDKDLTQNIHNDLIKKHRVKNIVIYAEINNVKILIENVESDKDYKFLSKLDLYAVNR